MSFLLYLSVGTYLIYGLSSYLDTDFIQHERGIELVSIGSVRETMGNYYAIYESFDANLASSWVQQHALPTLETYYAMQILALITGKTPVFIGAWLADCLAIIVGAIQKTS